MAVSKVLIFKLIQSSWEPYDTSKLKNIQIKNK